MSDETENELRYMKLTTRMCRCLFLAFRKGEYEGSSFEWDRVKKTLEYGKECSSGTRVDLRYMPIGAKEHLLKLMKQVERETYHKQLADAFRARISLLNDHLGVSAVDRLGEIM
jgi:hypothetical protein